MLTYCVPVKKSILFSFDNNVSKNSFVAVPEIYKQHAPVKELKLNANLLFDYF
jgi:hypothetical protein